MAVAATDGLRLELRRIEITAVHKLNEAENYFEGEIYIELAFPNGCSTHPQLVAVPKEGDPLTTQHFPMEADGKKPTFKPNAAWYLNRLVLENMQLSPMEQLKWRDQNVMVRDDDVVLTIYSQGRFRQRFELADFPFDAQDLTFTLTLNVQVGQVNEKTTLEEVCKTFPMRAPFDPYKPPTIAPMFLPGFHLDRDWEPMGYEATNKHIVAASHSIINSRGDEVTPNMRIEITSTSADGSDNPRFFPTANISIKVGRKPETYIRSLMVPCALFSLFALGAFSLEPDDSTRMEFSAACVLATIVIRAADVARAVVPNYHTLLDKYVFLHVSIVLLMGLEVCGARLALRVAQMQINEPCFPAITCPNGTSSPPVVNPDEDSYYGFTNYPTPVLTYNAIATVDSLCGLALVVLWLYTVIYYAFVCRALRQFRPSKLERPLLHARQQNSRRDFASWCGSLFSEKKATRHTRHLDEIALASDGTIV